MDGKQDPFVAAYSRAQRAWLEATHLHSHRTKGERKRLKVLGQLHSKGAQKLSEVFGSIKQNPCADCGRCCTNAGMDSGYYRHAERERLIEQGVNLFDFVVKSWEGQPEPPQRCLFLGPKGCNVPTEYRSNMCLTYVCRDLLGPEMQRQSAVPAYKKARKTVLRAGEKLGKMREIPYFTAVVNFGNG